MLTYIVRTEDNRVDAVELGRRVLCSSQVIRAQGAISREAESRLTIPGYSLSIFLKLDEMLV